MLTLALPTRIYLCLPPPDMRNSFDSLAALVRDEWNGDPFSGALFVFRSRRRDRIKLLYGDQDGFMLWAKRRERGTYQFPLAQAGADASGLTISPTELSLILSGIDLDSAKRRPRYHRPEPNRMEDFFDDSGHLTQPFACSRRPKRMEHASPVPDDSLPDDPLVLKRMIPELLPSLRHSNRENEPLRHRLDLLLKRLYGPRSEKITGPGLVDGIDPPEEPTPPPEPTAEPEPQPAPPKRHAHGRQKRARALPRERIDHDLTEAEKLCPCCRTPRVRIGEDGSEQLDDRPASLFIVERHRAKYVCRSCVEPHHQTAPLPPQPIDKGMPGAGLLAHVVTSKDADHLPRHRREGLRARLGVTLSRSTLCHWMAAAAQLLTVLYDRMLQRSRLSAVIHTDDTSVPVLDPRRNQTRQGRLWVYVGDRTHPFACFDDTPTHARDGPERILQSDRGYVQADALPGYNGLYASGAILEVGCWAHARRKFVEAKASDATRVHTALGFIGERYGTEAERKEKTDAQRVASRQSHAPPVLKRFRAWLEEQERLVLPKGPFAEAMRYPLSNFDALMRYTEAGFLNSDNNRSERTPRLVAIGRKNGMFAGSDQGGRTAAVLFSFTASCKHLKIDPFVDLRDVMTHLPELVPPTEEPLDFWLPDAWAARQRQTIEDPSA